MNKQDIYRQIQREYENERYKNTLLAEKRREQVYNRLSVVRDIDIQLKELGVKLTRLTVNHAPKAEISNIANQVNTLNSKKATALNSIGITEEYLAPIYTCPQCKDTGYINSQKCSCMKKRLIKKYYAASNLENVLQFENFDNFDLHHYSNTPYPDEDLTPMVNMSSILEDVLSQTAPEQNNCFNFYFYGNSGLGKTFMCSCIAKCMLDRGLSVIYMTAYSLASLLEKNRFRHEELDEADEAVDMLFDADLLIIDDLGTESPNSVTAAEIFNVINSRLINKKSTVISSNLRPAELSAPYSDRVVSRIVGNYTVHHFYGNDIRMK